jgi:hypothetical protein
MQKHIGWLGIVGFFGLVAAANAQTPPAPTPVTKYDGTYTIVSSTKVNETYITRQNRMGQCPDRIVGPLSVVSGQAHFVNITAGPYRFASPNFEGKVGSNGELEMRSAGGKCRWQHDRDDRPR